MNPSSKFSALATIGAAALVQVLTAGSAMAASERGQGRGNSENLGVVYVASQGLYYDTFGTTELPPKGPFQKLEMGPDGPYTEYGPGDRGYVGGRWWVDTNRDGEMDDMDMYFQCPLFGPGRTAP